jgi:hypothetical protein
VVDGNLYVDHYEEIAGRDSNNRVVVAGYKFFVTRVNLADPARPAMGPAINVPGVFVRERAQDSTWFTIEPKRNRDTGETTLTLSALYQPPGSSKAYLEGQVPLGNAGGDLLVGTQGAFTVNGGQLVSIDLRNPKDLKVTKSSIPGVVPQPEGSGTGGVAVGGAATRGPGGITYSSIHASARALAGDRLVLGINGGALVYDVRDPSRPALLGFVRGAQYGSQGRTVDLGGTVFLQGGLYGLEPLPAAP